MMHNFVQILGEIENLFLSNSHNISTLVGALIESDNLFEITNDGTSLGLLNTLKKAAIKPQTDNSKYKIDALKQRVQKSKTGRKPQMMISKDKLRNLIYIGSKNTDVSKSLNAGRNLVACYVTCH